MSTERPCSDGILVLDYGSQYTLLIVRRLREIGVYSELIDGEAANPPADFNVQGVILSGGPDSVTHTSSRKLPKWVHDLDVPKLGICYGMQLLVEDLGGKVVEGERREYGAAQLELKVESGVSPLFNHLTHDELKVWMSHGDHVKKIPANMQILAETNDQVIAAIGDFDNKVFGLQFHPEVHHTQCGRQLLKNFVFEVCEFRANWNADPMIEALTNQIKADVGEGKVLIAVSGGVDSTVAATLLNQAVDPDKLYAVLVDTGLMRKNEIQWVSEWFKKTGLKHFEVLDRQRSFLDALKGVTDPEEKRKIIGRKFIEEFEAFAEGKGFTHLGQGTLYPDVIESAGHGAGAKVIKSHHNVGGLPEKLKLRLVEPFRYLFKDEVRKIGDSLGLPHDLVYRHPFPGPGLGIRILGEVEESLLALLREADAIYIDALREFGLYDSVWQAFAVLLPVKSVGVMGDNRTYQYTLALRAVDAVDGMTANCSALPMDFLTTVSDRIVRQVDGINRVVYDITSKPPATIEWE